MASSEISNRRPVTLIVPRQSSLESSVGSEINDKAPSNRSSVSSVNIRHNSKVSTSPSLHQTFRVRSATVQSNPSSEFPNCTDDENDLDDDILTKDDYRFAPQVIRNRRRNSTYSISQRQTWASSKPNVLHIQAPSSRTISAMTKPSSFINDTGVYMINEQAIAAAAAATNSYKDSRGQTLLHLAARLGHDEILRLLICETSQANILTNTRGQTPLLTAIEGGSTSTATLLMESNPRSIILSDDNGSNVFHYACEYCNDVVLNRAIALLKRLYSTSDRIKALKSVTERNRFGKTALDIAIEKGQLKCVKQFLLSSWLDANIDIQELINADALRSAIDQDQLDILNFFVINAKRFAYVLNLLITVDGRDFNLLEYAIYLKKTDIVRLFVSVRIPVEQYTFRQQYKSFLLHYSEPFIQSGSLSFCQTPLQRMLLTPECVRLVPLMLEQFVNNNGIDFSIIDDCLYARPVKTRCIFGQAKHFATTNWFQEHPLTLIAKADCEAVYDHPLVRMCVDLKFNLFGNFLYLLILCFQSIYVALYTGIALGSPTPTSQGSNYYLMYNYSCIDLCLTLANNPINPAQDQPSIRALRFILLLLSCSGLLKEFYQTITQRQEYFRHLYINLIESHVFVSAIIYSVDLNECTRQTGLRCTTQWMTGGIGLLSVWTSLLFVVMNGIKFGKYGLLFVTVFVTFLKLIAVYIFIWIGYILAFYMICKDILDQFHFFNFVPKLLAMFIGEYDLDSTYFPQNQLIPGGEAAILLYGAYMFTMFIVMTSIMGGLAVVDVKLFRQNAKREHLRARIGVVLGFQAHLGPLCETIGSITMQLCKNKKWLDFFKKTNLTLMKYQLENIEIHSYPVNMPRSLAAEYYSSSATQARRERNVRRQSFDQIYPETGFYLHNRTIQNFSLFNEDDNTRLSKKTDEIRDALEETTIKTNNELRKFAMELENEIEDIKRQIIRQGLQNVVN